jgi:hypothetical protein
VHPGEGAGELAGGVPVEILILPVTDLRPWPGPQGRGLVDRRIGGARVFVGHHDRHADVIRVPVDDRAQPAAVQQLVLALAELEQGDERHPVGHDERRVEPDAELADEGRVLPLIARQRAEEFAGTRLGDGPDVLDHLPPAHADPVVGDRDRARVPVVTHPYAQRVFLYRLLPETNSSRRLSIASDAFEISSRRKISLLLYSELMTRSRIWTASA